MFGEIFQNIKQRRTAFPDQNIENTRNKALNDTPIMFLEQIENVLYLSDFRVSLIMTNESMV